MSERNLWREDQQRAAEAHTARLIDGLAGHLPGGSTRTVIDETNAPGWLVAIIERHNFMQSTMGKACDHVADLIPGPRVIVPWMPGVIVCANCLARGVLLPPLDSDAEYTCDVCGVLHREGVRATVIHVTADTMLYLGVCAGCLPSIPMAQS